MVVVVVKVVLVFLPYLACKLGPLLPRPLLQNKGGTKRYKPTSSLLSRRNKVLGVGKTIVFDGKMGMRKFGSAAPPFSKVTYAVKVKILFIVL